MGIARPAGRLAERHLARDVLSLDSAGRFNAERIFPRRNAINAERLSPSTPERRRRETIFPRRATKPTWRDFPLLPKRR